MKSVKGFIVVTAAMLFSMLAVAAPRPGKKCVVVGWDQSVQFYIPVSRRRYGRAHEQYRHDVKISVHLRSGRMVCEISF